MMRHNCVYSRQICLLVVWYTSWFICWTRQGMYFYCSYFKIFVKIMFSLFIGKCSELVGMAHVFHPPEARAVADDQGETLNCTLHAVSKAVTEGNRQQYITIQEKNAIIDACSNAYIFIHFHPLSSSLIRFPPFTPSFAHFSYQLICFGTLFVAIFCEAVF